MSWDLRTPIFLKEIAEGNLESYTARRYIGTDNYKVVSIDEKLDVRMLRSVPDVLDQSMRSWFRPTAYPNIIPTIRHGLVRSTIAIGNLDHIESLNMRVRPAQFRTF